MTTIDFSIAPAVDLSSEEKEELLWSTKKVEGLESSTYRFL